MADFKIRTKNRQTIDGEHDTVEECAEGRVCLKGGKKYIIYKVKTENGENSVIITVSDGRVTVKRSGAVSSSMVFDRNRKTQTVYRMPYGNLNMEITTDKIVDAMTEDGGRLRIVYTMMMQGQKFCNDIEITADRNV